MKWNRWPAAACALVFLVAGVVSAQEPAFMEAATQPGADQYYARLLFLVGERSDADSAVDEFTARIKLAYGVDANLAALLDADFQHVRSNPGSESEEGFSQATLRLKYRVLRHDLGPLNTWRASVLAGADIPGTSDELARDHASPRLGMVTTAILGRHGLNAQFDWTGRVGDPDLFALNASHLYRLAPAEYSAQTSGAWYTMVESLNEFSDSGDSRADLAVGILYEARRWAWEASYRLPLAENWPSEIDYQVETGVRCLF